ncbi:MAG: HPr family phosphocarrier protein [Candidatus Hydrogenedentota bacterium]
MTAVEEDMMILNKLGMHLRPAQRFVQTVLKFQCDVYLQKDGQRVNAKSIMGLLTLAAAQGARLLVICEGGDADDAMTAIRDLISSGFGEEM